MINGVEYHRENKFRNIDVKIVVRCLKAVIPSSITVEWENFPGYLKRIPRKVPFMHAIRSLTDEEEGILNGGNRVGKKYIGKID